MATRVFAQGTISTIAGGSDFLDNIPAVQAHLTGPYGLAVDQKGNAYIGEGPLIRKVTAVTGLIATVITGAAGSDFMAFTAAGKLLFLGGDGLQELDAATGALTTIPLPPSADVGGLTADAEGNIFLTDNYYGKIYRIDAISGALTTVAGIGPVGNTGSPQGDGGPATQAGLVRPYVITVDQFGDLFFAEQNWLRRIDGKTGIITTIAPNGESASSGDGGPYSKATFRSVSALAIDSKGNLYIGDGPYVREINWTTGIITRIVGSGQQQYAQDGVPALQANLSSVSGLVIDTQANIWISDPGNARVFIVAASTDLIKTVAGTSGNGDGGPATGAVLSAIGLAADTQGDLYFHDTSGIRRVDHATGFISTVAPSSAFAFSGTLGDGASTLSLDTNGNLFQCAQGSVQRIDARTGAVTVVAGNNTGQYVDGNNLGDGGPATQAQITPAAVAIDSTGNLYIADYFHGRIRRVDAATGIITTIAGIGQVQTLSGVPGPALQAAIGAPTDIVLAPDGDIYFTTNARVLKLDSAGMLSIVAGNGGCSYSGDGGSALLASVCGPAALAFDTTGNLFVSDGYCYCVRRIDAQTGIIQTVAGTGSTGMSKDGIPATQAPLTPGAIAFLNGVLYVIDGPPPASARIRAVTPPAPPPLPQPPSITAISDAVDFQPSFSPGAIVSVFGNYLGQSPIAGQIGTNGLFAKQLAGDQVTFGGIPAPVLYASAGQINTIVPYATQPGTAPVQVTTNAGTSTIDNIQISPVSLSLFPFVFNPDGTLNSVSNPAPKGATLVMYGTGMGQTNPPGVDGSIIQAPPFPMPLAQFTATVASGGNQYQTTISYLGPLPGFVAGAVQANVQIPANVPPGLSDLYISPYFGSGSGTQMEPIFMRSDPPVLTGISPASPITQNVNVTNNFMLTGQSLLNITSLNLFLNGQPANVKALLAQACTSTSCSIAINFVGASGDFGLSVTNAANQVSNQLTFTVEPYPPPAVTGVNSNGGPVIATKGPQLLGVLGTNFLAPDTVTIFYNGAQIATLNSLSPFPPQVDNPQLIGVQFDFQGNAGQYGIQVTGTNGSSAVYNFTAASP